MRANSIWNNKEYLKFFAAFTTGNIGDWFDIFALQLIYANQFHASPIMLSLLLIVYLAPMAFFGSYAGIISDKFKKKHILIITDIFSGVATLLLITINNLELSLVIVFLRSSIACLNSPAQQAALKYIVSEEQLLAASSYNQIVFQLCQVIGPLVGALVIAISSPYCCLGINAISFFISAFFLITLKPIAELPHEKLEKIKFITNFKQTLKVISDNKVLFNIFIFASCISIPVMMGYSQLVLLLKVLYPGEQSILGIVTGIGGIGTIVSGVYLSNKKDLTKCAIYLIIGTLLMGASNIVYALYPKNFNHHYPLYMASFIGGIGFGIIIIIYSYLQKKETPHQYMGRVSGTMSMFMSSFYIAGAFLGGVITSIVGIRLTFTIMSVICFLLIFYIVLRYKKFSIVKLKVDFE